MNRWRCDLCGRELRSRKLLQQHINTNHAVVRPADRINPPSGRNQQ